MHIFPHLCNSQNRKNKSDDPRVYLVLNGVLQNKVLCNQDVYVTEIIFITQKYLKIK